jgi:hypothetical protein
MTLKIFTSRDPEMEMLRGMRMEKEKRSSGFLDL